MNKIDGFEGDNDNVDEEYEESSNDNNSTERKKHNRQKNLVEDDCEYMDSDSKLYRLSLTPGCNILSERSEYRIFSDLSSKVVNINSGTGPN